jgi:FkbM family methyltransferase
LLHRFTPYSGPGTPGFTTNFLGVRARTAFVGPHAPFDGIVERVPEPEGSLQGETAEWLGTLKAVLSAEGSWRLLELGAGYGPWMANSVAAARQRGIADIRVYGVEGDAGHVAFMHQHMADNGIDPAEYRIMAGVVGAADGTAAWAEVADAAQVYGGRPLGEDGVDYHGAAQPRQTTVPMFGIDRLLGHEPRWDLVHIDIQGGEGEVCRAGMAMLTERVKWIVIGTHSRALDGELMVAFHAAGWSLEHEKPTMMTWRDGAPTLETLARVDGVQVWRNPRLAQPVT